jgi:uncharacterized delta-60 repeat protein
VKGFFVIKFHNSDNSNFVFLTAVNCKAYRCHYPHALYFGICGRCISKIPPVNIVVLQTLALLNVAFKSSKTSTMKKLLLFLLFAPAYTITNGQPGTLDSSFGSNGITSTSFGTSYTIYSAIATYPDGRIVTVGQTGVSVDKSFAVARYNRNGTLDLSFAEYGRATFQFGFGTAAAAALSISADQKIIVAGYANNNGQTDFAIARLNEDGSFDTSFSDDGKVSIDMRGQEDIAYAVSIQQDGKIVLGGTSQYGAQSQFAILRLNVDGTRDNTFGEEGLVLEPVLGISRAYSLIIQPDGKIIAAGGSNASDATDPYNQDFALVRFDPDGSLDRSFGTGGIVSTDFFGWWDEAMSVDLQSDGKIVVAGNILRPGHGSDFGIARYNSDGSPDNDFSGTGRLNLDLGSTSESASSVGVQTDGKIILAGYGIGARFSDFFVVRLNADGALDNTFSHDGKLIFGEENRNEAIAGLAIYKDHVYVAGWIGSGDQLGAVAAIRIEDNKAPVAGAWLQKYYTPTSVLLAAWGSADPEGGPITYFWEKTAGPHGSALLYGNSASPVVTGLVNGTYSFRLTVTDRLGATGTASLTFTIVENLRPIAGTWLQKYYTPTSVLLAAWGSYDPEGGPITYYWEKLAGPPGTTLLYGNSASPVVNGLVNGEYTYKLTVTDNKGATGTSALTFTVSNAPAGSTSERKSLPAEQQTNANHGKDIVVYPNPVIGNLRFTWTNQYTGSATVSIMNSSGQQVKTIHIEKDRERYYGSVDVSTLKAGTYRLYITDGKKGGMRLFIIQ